MTNPDQWDEALGAELAKLIALRLGYDAAVREIDLPALDALSYFIWPVYPEIAENLSLPGSGYVWLWGAKTRDYLKRNEAVR